MMGRQHFQTQVCVYPFITQLEKSPWRYLKHTCFITSSISGNVSFAYDHHGAQTLEKTKSPLHQGDGLGHSHVQWTHSTSTEHTVLLRACL
jgi:hypothetical protein